MVAIDNNGIYKLYIWKGVMVWLHGFTNSIVVI